MRAFARAVSRSEISFSGDCQNYRGETGSTFSEIGSIPIWSRRPNTRSRKNSRNASEATSERERALARAGTGGPVYCVLWAPKRFRERPTAAPVRLHAEASPFIIDADAAESFCGR